MPISSKRIGSQQTISRHNQQQALSQDNGYDDYVYYPYYTNSTPNNGYEYSRQGSTQYYQPRSTTNSAPVRQT